MKRGEDEKEYLEGETIKLSILEVAHPVYWKSKI